MEINFKQWLIGAASALTLCLPLGSQAEPFFFNKDISMVLDKATGLVWQTCSVGQTWDGKTCAGQAKTFTFEDAHRQTKDGWRLPTVRELASLIYCSSGQTKKMDDLKDGGPPIPNECVGNYSKPSINTTAFPQTPSEWFWSSSPSYADASRVVYFGYGYISSYEHSKSNAVRLVRARQSLGSEADLEFPLSISEYQRLIEAKRREEQRIAEAEERRVKAQRTAAERSLIAGGAQDIYLKAGKAQRSGSVTVGGISFYASELYEMVVEKFPKSEYAVKASDQLNAVDRTERQSSAVRDADRNASNRAACFSQVNSCQASCRASSMSYGGIQDCVSNCQRTCN